VLLAVGLRPRVTPPPPPTHEVQNDQPTLQAYRRALADSPEALDALLRQHAAGPPGAAADDYHPITYVSFDSIR
jgi:hypothetical protein